MSGDKKNGIKIYVDQKLFLPPPKYIAIKNNANIISRRLSSEI